MNKYIIIPILFFLLSLGVIFGSLAYQPRPNVDAIPTNNKGGQNEFTEKTISEPAAATNTPGRSVKATEVSLISVGDVMLSRNVAVKIKKYSDFNYPFASTSAYLKSADAVFGNLESPITPGPTVPTGSFIFHADPGVESALADANFKILSLANNHLPNYGQRGIENTIKYLDEVNIAHAGAGRDLAEASKPALLKVGDFEFALFAYNDSDVAPPGYGATASSAGTVLMDVTRMQQAVSTAKNQAQFVIVSMHSGAEYTEELTESQIEFAHAAVDAGAELVLGHHPHVTQRVEKYKDKYIFYSLGNFIFDQMWSEETRRGIAVKFYFNDIGLVRAEVTPLVIMDYARPVFADQKTAEEIYGRLRLESTDNFIKLIPY